MKTTLYSGSRHGIAMVLGALGAMVLAAGCSSSSAGSAFGDPGSDDAGDDGSASYGGSSGAGSDAAGASDTGHAVPHDAGDGATNLAAPPCHGTPSSCASAGSEAACDALGCTWGGMCTGNALPCPGLDQSKCGIQQNCVYDSATFQCSGTAYGCSVLSAAYGCTTQQGCAWTMGCSGTASVACSSLGSSTACTAAGCAWN